MCVCDCVLTFATLPTKALRQRLRASCALVTGLEHGKEPAQLVRYALVRIVGFTVLRAVPSTRYRKVHGWPPSKVVLIAVVIVVVVVEVVMVVA